MATTDLTGGVKMDPTLPNDGDSVAISYSGKLAQNSNDITLNVGYGKPNKFFDTQKVTMQKKGNEYQAHFKVKFSDRMNMYFEDSQGSKDDNNGSFYQAQAVADYESYG
ncbi:MAG TPA: hypothetical protein VFC73_03905 [Syntrophomonadaceae bacterium]|nr:hypothetical protein [Syntrophomonadaceae bacterium]